MISITKPTLILDHKKVLHNIELMSEKAKKHNVIFRPHFKTHQSKAVGRWFRDFDVKCITVSSVSMAKYFAEDGWDDITIAFPFNILELDEISKLSENIALNILIVDEETLKIIDDQIKSEIGIFIKIDTGYNRSGIDSESIIEIERIIDILSSSEKLTFKGFLTHAGNTYKATSTQQILDIHGDSVKKMLALKKQYSALDPIISIGDTPACSLADEFSGIDEIRPGNFVFYDLTQWQLGGCKATDIAIVTACPIVQIKPNDNSIVVYGGGVHHSKESILFEGATIFGLGSTISNGRFSEPNPNLIVTSLSQEHGVISIKNLDINRFKIGDLIGIYPIHSCMTANLMGEYVTLDGKKYDHLAGQNKK